MTDDVLRVWACPHCGDEAWTPMADSYVWCYRCEEVMMDDTGQRIVVDENDHVVRVK